MTRHKSFIEVQFPVSKVSKESYKERKAGQSQTLTGFGKWWGRKPLILVRTAVLGLLMPASDQPEKDREIFLKILAMDVAPDENDLGRERKVIKMLKDKFQDWREKGFIPSEKIIEGDNTNQPRYEKGWQYWHQLFNSRQLLLNGLFSEISDSISKNQFEKIITCLGINGISNRNSKLSIWDSGSQKGIQTFANQAFNTLFNYAVRSLSAIYSAWKFDLKKSHFINLSCSEPLDARLINDEKCIWITDPPYADAVHYHELTDFFLSWDKKIIEDIFPDWHTDSKRVLAVKGTGENFNKSMVDIYRNLADNMPENGLQIVMFTHQDPSVWADLTMILWAAGLHVTAAWNIATETESGGLKEGNYVKGTVLLVLRKQTSDATAFLDQIYSEIEFEVKAQIDSMQKIDDREDPNFSDADYILAAFAASLKVLTSYKQYGDMDVEYELKKARDTHTASPIEKLIDESIKIAYDYLIPAGFDSFIWKNLQAEERFYIKGIELEKRHIMQLGAYQEMARGFGVKDYKELLASKKANQVCLKSAAEFASKQLKASDHFSNSLIRHVLMAINQSIKAENANNGKNWLRNECYGHNWNVRNTIIALLDYFSRLEHHSGMSRWSQQADYAKYIKELVKHDGI